LVGAAAAVVAGPPAARAAPPPAGDPAQLTPSQALAQAQDSGTDVEVTGATTATDRLVANHNGTFTLSRSISPTRKRVGGAWRGLDSSLQRADDGSVAPAVTTGALRLPGGHGDRTVTLGSGERTMSFDLPFTLPTPTLSGATATYAEVLPGVDLQLIADTQGGLRQVLVVRTAAAAANPALSEIQLATRAPDLNIDADASGNLTAVDGQGHAVFQAPTPLMWDSAAQQGLASSTGVAKASNAHGPGTSARTARVGVRVTRPESGGTRIDLTPDRALLGDPNAVYPLYIDPSWGQSGYNNNSVGWATVSKNFASQKYWRSTPDPQGRMQVGNSGSIWSHTLLNLATPLHLRGAQINTATLRLLNAYSFSCTAYGMDIYAPSATLTSGNADWNSWANVGMGGAIASRSFAHGYNSGCAAATEGFDIKGTVVNALNASKSTQTFALIAQNESSSNFGYKEFDPNNTTIDITYNWRPNTPDQLSTSPSSACSASPPSAVGDGPVTLYARVTDNDGGNLGVGFNVWKTSNPSQYIASTNWSTFSYPSGSTAVFVLPQALLRSHAGGALTDFSWKVQTTDNELNSAESTVCTFRFDPTRAGAPTVAQSGSATIAQPATFTVAPPSGVIPSSYLFQLNGGAPRTVTATNGNASFTVTPNRFTNTLSVISLSAGGNVGDSATVVFNATAATPQADQDLSGDNIPDLVTVGSRYGLPAGVWVANGKAGTGHTTGTGQIRSGTSNYGIFGNGVAGDNSPANFNGAQILTGHFTGSNLQDVLAYYPGGTNPGSGMVINGNGDGSPMQAQLSGNEHTISAGLLNDINNNNPLQLANAYNGSGQNFLYPDLIGISGDATNGYYLNYYASQNGINNYQFPAQLNKLTPTGGTDWNAWTITTALVGGTTSMFLWKKSTGALYLWRNITFDLNTWTLGNTQYTIAASGWKTNVDQALQAADIDGNSTPDLWTVGTNSSGTVATAYLVSNLTGGTGTATAQPVQNLRTAKHIWALDDGTSGTATTAKDDAGTLDLTAQGGVTWQTGDMFASSARLNQATGSALATTSAAVTPSADFTVSIWVKPADLDHGYLLSQDSASGNSTFRLFIDPTTRAWTFSMLNAENGAWVNTTSYTPAKVGVWQHLTLTHVAATNRNTLFYNGTAGPSIALGGAPTSLGPFRVGAYRAGGTLHPDFSGQVAMVETWNQALTRAEVTALSGNPDYVMFEGDNTNYVSGMSWKTEGATLTFSAGQLIIHQTKSQSGTVTFGTGGYPNAVLTFQPDGNLVVYPQAAHTVGTATWSPNIYPYPDMVWVLQPDGNLVAYDKDGIVRWASGTYN
jgi:hypothetical protein